jgi:XTP/dITP diphosphohydrolase
MKPILYATGNAIKFQLAQHVCSTYNIQLEQIALDVPEIQSEQGEPVARDKAEKAFAKFGKPVVVSDDSWMIPGLKNFPGPYMKSMNDWFTPDDWLRLTSVLEDRRVILRQIVVYQDSDVQKLFFTDIEGEMLREARGKSPFAHATITSFDGKQSNAEYHERGENAAQNRPTSWHDFAEWYKGNHGN